jgi:hypothetical protein
MFAKVKEGAATKDKKDEGRGNNSFYNMDKLIVDFI